MSRMQCNREAEVVDAVSAGQWPDGCPAELLQHVNSCAICAEVAGIATLLRNDYASIAGKARVPSAALVWWRAELRARREALRAAERPMTIARAFAGAGAIGVFLAVLSLVSPWFQQAVLGMMPFVNDLSMIVLREHLPLTLTLAALVIIAPVAFYFVLSDK